MARDPAVQSHVESYQNSENGTDATLFNTQHYKVRIKSKWINPGKAACVPLHPGILANAKKLWGGPQPRSANLCIYIVIHR